MKKMFSLLIAASMLTTTAFADADSVLLKIKDRIPDTSEYKNFEVSQTNQTYRYNWNSEDSWLNVSADEDGNILYYNFDSDNDEPQKRRFQRFSEQEKLQNEAYSAAQAMNPAYADEFKLESRGSRSVWDSSNSYSIVQYYMGIPVEGANNYIRISDGKPTSYSYNHIDTSTCEAGDIMTEAQRKETFINNQGLELCYKSDDDYKSKTRKIYTAYCIKDNDMGIDAITGELKNYTNYHVYMENMAAADAAVSGGGASRKFSETETVEFEKMSDLFSKEDLIEIAKSNKLFSLAQCEEKGFSLRKDRYEEKYYANINFISDDMHADINMDAKTGEIISASLYNKKDSDSTVDANYNELCAEALTLLAGAKLGEYKEIKTDDNDYMYSKEFVRIANGLPFYDNKIRISFNKKTGKLSDYSISYYDTVIPEPRHNISLVNALDILFEKAEFETIWMDTEHDDKGEVTQKSPICKFDKPDIIIDAADGKVVNDYYKDEVTKLEYSDVNTSVYGNEINDLADMGIGYKENELKPEKNMTYIEFLTLAQNVIDYSSPVAVGGDYDYSDTIESLKSQKIIDENFKAESSITKSEACTFIAKLLDIEKISSLSNIFIAPSDDVKENIGNIAILCAMNIADIESDGKFHPDMNLTREQGLAMIYNYILNEFDN